MPSGKRATITWFLALSVAALLSGCLADTAPGGSDDGPNTAAADNNSTPAIAGTPRTASLIGEIYSFTPTASDADGDPLTFSVTGLPRWATFDSATGRLAGQLSLGDEGTYSNIRITVTDGEASRSLPTFSITVSAIANGAIELSWEAPTENEDGTALVDLAGFNIYYGSRWGVYSNVARIDNPSISTYLIENLLPDTYYVVMTAFNADGVESGYSGVAIKRANPR